MENVKIFVDGIQKDVYGLFYVFNSKYYFIYTENEVDENGYVILYMSQVGKETKNTETGPVDTGYMIGVEVTNPEEQQRVQTSISYIVEDKKNNTINSEIQYLPMSMLTNLKIISKKRFRLLKSIIVDNFNVPFENAVDSQIESDNFINKVDPIVSNENSSSIVTVESSDQTQTLQNMNNIQDQLQENISDDNNISSNESNIIIDYRSKYFEEEEKNKELQAQIDELTNKLNEIRKVIE
jgi:hypothetical protein